MRNFFLNYLRYRDSNQIMIAIDYNRVNGSFDQSLKGHFKIRIQAL